MKRYVAGLLMNKKEGRLVLIEKRRPAWMKGKLNAVGGLIEAGESPHTAMVREFEEETGVKTQHWISFARLCGVNEEGPWEVEWFWQEAPMETLLKCHSLTDEPVGVYGFEDMDELVLPNVLWLFVMAMTQADDSCLYHVIHEATDQTPE